jgi:nitrite reductase/ring-hydroxylating ferredoxin subunit
MIRRKTGQGSQVMADEGKWVRAMSASALAEGEMAPAEVGGRSVAIYHLDDGTWCASDNVCTHAMAVLTDGWLEGCTIECPLHGGRFDLLTGAGQGAPIEQDLVLYPVRVEGDDVLVRLP